VVWFVDDSAPAGGNGTRSAPFNSFAPVNGTSGAGDIDAVGDTIFVFAGTYNGNKMEAAWRAYLVKNRLYQVGVLSFGQAPAAADVRKFFDSFTLEK